METFTHYTYTLQNSVSFVTMFDHSSTRISNAKFIHSNYISSVSISARCSLEPITGMCRAALPAFYYDANAGACKPFTYGGCGGNGWIFYCEEECDIVCVQRKNIDDFVEDLEWLLRANFTGDPNSSEAKDVKDDKSHSSGTSRSKEDRHHFGRSHSSRREKAKNERLSAIFGEEHRAVLDTAPRPRYICPLQEAFEGADAVADDVQKRNDEPSDKPGKRHPPRS